MHKLTSPLLVGSQSHWLLHMWY